MKCKHVLSTVWLSAAMLTAGALLQSCSAGSTASSDPTESTGEGDDWPLHGRTAGEQRFSRLDAINESNVAQLGLAWSYKINPDRGLEATPIVVDGVMYTTGPWSIVYALDAETGKELWAFDPGVDRSIAGRACCDVVNRGVAVSQGKVIVGALDGRLIAVDAKTGKSVWSVDTIIDHNKNYTITGAPRLAGNKVIIGNGGAEYGVRGYITAYDVNNGREAWRFYTVPGDPAKPPEDEAMAMARKTWFGTEYAKYGGGGTVWDSMAYDPKLNLLYIGTGNASVWGRNLRSQGKGDNLFVSSIVAINPDTGKYVWHYQEVPGEEWDFTASQHMILADIEIEGKLRKVIMQAPKNGFFYVLDRTNGQFISAKNFVPQNWAKAIDPQTGRPIINDEAVRYEDGKLKLVNNAVFGAHNWHPMSYSPKTGLVYIPAQLTASYMQSVPGAEMPKTLGSMQFGAIPAVAPPRPSGDNSPADPAKQLDLRKPEDVKRMQEGIHGRLIAWDPVKQKQVWSHDYKSMYNGGTLATAGNLVFQGTGDGRFVAYRATDGKQLWEAPTNTGVVAGPITYRIKGVQYVAVSAGWGGAYTLFGGPASLVANVRPDARMLVFKIGGTAKLPPPKPPLGKPPILSMNKSITPAQLANGRLNFAIHCSVCHGLEAISGGVVPDLRYMSADTFNAFSGILAGGFASQDMPDFSEKLTPAEQEEIKQYIASRNAALRSEAK